MVSKFRGRNFFKGVECNIPPVSIGILPVDRAKGLKFKVSMENINMRCQLNTDKVSVSDLTRLRQGQFGNCTGKDIYLVLAPKYLTFSYSFSL
jgi:hypothetical protein